MARKQRYKSELQTIKRVERYYPPEALKKQLNDYCEHTGTPKSTLAVKLVKAFFAARNKEGSDPKVIVIKL